MSYGLRINLFKSSIGGLGVDPISLGRYDALLNCKIMCSVAYLAVSIGENQTRDILERIDREGEKKFV